VAAPFDVSDPRAYLEGYRDLAGFDLAGDGGDRRVTFPSVHSFVENPEGALGAAERMVIHALTGKEPVRLDRSACTRVNGCAETVTAALLQQVKEAEPEIELQRDPPRDPIARDVCDCFTLEPDPSATTAGMLTRIFRDKREMSLVSMVTTDLLREQLETDRYRLDKGLLSDLGSFFVGEALDNSLAYGAGDCWLSAVVRKGVAADALARVELSIFNLGPSMDQTIMNGATTDSARAQLEALVEHHHAAGHFVNGWSQETLLVRQAMQQRVTSSGRVTGGVGSRGMISFYTELARRAPGSSPVCVIITGTTFVRMSPQYRLKRSRIPGRPETIKDIAFNRRNDFRLPADSACFTTLARRLPGTLVALQFTLDPTHLLKREVPR
jgi:hypothetical protein